ncbi:M1 family metallopeptidase [Georgenia sp. SYP-B2076]|uniref:M1 family metallopeptidase n=1 Tax=Georgenia sp. SYP-B2076 TaxID=2495881 RepID=UPI0013DED60B|nr:M1 family metallopeptidase [Georgenia sp. SYP-B2076]
MRRRCRLLAVLLLALLLLVACTRSPEPPAPTPTSSGWPAPSPSRPVVELRFDVADDLRSVQGSERVTFTPDLRVCELVFRAWPNKPSTAEAGNSLTVGTVSVDGTRVPADVQAAGAPDGAPGTLIDVPLPSCVDAGTSVEASLTFSLVLGEDTDERVGTSSEDEVAWFGGAYPLLAWQPGVGWAKEAAVPVVGEVSTSEDVELRSLEVVASSRFDVLGVGSQEGTRTDGSGRTTHRFTAPAVRDIAVTVGDLETYEQQIDGVAVHIGAPKLGTQAQLRHWADQIASSLTRLRDQLGPVPYDDLWISVLPAVSDGIEFPGAVQFADVDPQQNGGLVTHELAHMWFYGLVGNNQGLHPWLDESFATFVQRVVDNPDRDPAPSNDVPDRARGDVGEPMSFWLDFDRPNRAYVRGVYDAGADALIEARQRAGAKAFDEALRGYLRANAHKIATPDDVARAFANLPEALTVLQRAGALTAPAA